MKKKLVVVVGPTAVGKTTLAIDLAKHFNTEIVSADSRQFYREMCIGTAKPDAAERAAAPHHFIDSHSIRDVYSAGDFERDALPVLDGIFKHRDVAILVGGSGLFVRALTEGLDDLPQAPDHIRQDLNQQLQNEGLAALQNRLQAIDPTHYASMDYQNPQRVVRALEVHATTGKSIAYYQQQKRTARAFDVVTIGLNMDREALYRRINERVDRMMTQGLLEEVKALSAYQNHPALQTVGYAELFEVINNQSSLEAAVNRIKQNSRRYAKRQITWFKKYGHTNWFDPQDWPGILQFLKKSGFSSARENG